MKHLVRLAALAALVAASGRLLADKLPEGAKAVMDKAATLELFALDPSAGETKAKGTFHGWKVLGVVQVKDAAARKALLAAIEKGAAGEARPKKCFEPRHGLRAAVGGKTVDLVICYACGFMEVHQGEGRGKVFTDRTPVAALDKILTDAKVPLPK